MASDFEVGWDGPLHARHWLGRCSLASCSAVRWRSRRRRGAEIVNNMRITSRHDRRAQAIDRCVRRGHLREQPPLAGVGAAPAGVEQVLEVRDVRRGVLDHAHIGHT